MKHDDSSAHRTANEALDALSPLLKETGVAVLDIGEDMPVYDEPYVTPHLVVAINHSGTVTAEYDQTVMEAGAHEVAFVAPKHMMRRLGASPDYRCTLIVVSSEAMEQMRQYVSYRNYLTYHKNPRFKLTDEQYDTMNNIANLLKLTCKMKCRQQHNIIMHELEIMYMLLDEFRIMNQPEDKGEGSPLFARFYDLLTENYTKSREVKFYAKQLCLSPKYFGTVISKETGTSAIKWIANYVVLQAKAMLTHNRNMSIQQVSERMGFPDQATFARYFKLNTGLTPKDFRKQRR